MNWWRRIAQSRLLDGGAAFIALLCVIRIALMLHSRVWGFDFNIFYVPGRMLLDGQNPYTTSLEPLARQLGFQFSAELSRAGYPPSFLWIFAALAMLPPRVAFVVWVAGEILCLWLILILTRRLLADRLTKRSWFFLCAGAVISETVFYHFCYSQVQLLLAAMALLAFYWHGQGKHYRACVMIAAAGMLKFYPFVLLPWFCWHAAGNFRERFARAGLSVVVCLAILALTGWPMWLDFFRIGIPMAVGEEINRNFHYSLPALITNLGLARSGFAEHGNILRPWWMAGTVAGLLVIGLAYWRALCAQDDAEGQFALLCVAMLAGTVTVQGHYFVWLFFPLAVAATRVCARITAGRVIFLAATILLLNRVTPPDPSLFASHIYLKVLVNYIPFYALLALGTFLAKGECVCSAPRGLVESRA